MAKIKQNWKIVSPLYALLPWAYWVKMVNTTDLKSIPMGYQFKFDSEHTCFVKMVDTTVSKFVVMGYWFKSNIEYPNVKIGK